MTTTGEDKDQEAGSTLNDMPSHQALTGLQTFDQEGEEPLDQQFSLLSPLTSLVSNKPHSSQAVSVGPMSPPIPRKLVDKIWRGEYVEMQELLPARLGAPAPTVLDALLRSEKMKAKKEISTIQEWVVCFNTFISIIAMKKPEQVRDLLAYSSTIVKASQDFEGLPWLDYDIHFRRQLATKKDPQWAQIDASLWTVYFARATPKTTVDSTRGEKTATNAQKRQFPSKNRFNPYPSNKVCFKWNSPKGCDLVECKFLHCCIHCRDTSHRSFECPQSWGKGGVQSRSQGQGWQGRDDDSFRPPMGRR